MKKTILLLIPFIFFLSSPVLAGVGEAFDDIDTTNYSHTTQNLKPFTNKQYQDAINQYKNNFQKPKKEKEKNKIIPTSNYSNADDFDKEFSAFQEVINHKGAVMIPATCIAANGEIINPGHYALEYYQDNLNNDWLILSQGSKIFAKLKARPSNVSDKEESVNFAYAVGKSDIITLIYGNIDVAVESDLQIIN